MDLDGYISEQTWRISVALSAISVLLPITSCAVSKKPKTLIFDQLMANPEACCISRKALRITSAGLSKLLKTPLH
jgi:hypothetical protein